MGKVIVITASMGGVGFHFLYSIDLEHGGYTMTQGNDGNSGWLWFTINGAMISPMLSNNKVSGITILNMALYNTFLFLRTFNQG